QVILDEDLMEDECAENTSSVPAVVDIDQPGFGALDLQGVESHESTAALLEDRRLLLQSPVLLDLSRTVGIEDDGRGSRRCSGGPVKFDGDGTEEVPVSMPGDELVDYPPTPD